jgi:excisionase family DNA binding protein
VTSKEWFTVEEAAEYLRVSRRTIYKLTTDGRLPAFRIGEERHRRFRKEDLDKVPRLGEVIKSPEKSTESLRGPVESIPRVTAESDPALAGIWDNEKDAAYDRL